MWLLDTNVCVSFLRSGSHTKIARRLAEVGRDDVVLCSIVKAELFFGAIRSNEPAANLVKVNQFLGRFQSVPFDDVAAAAYGYIRADLAARGMMIGPNDLLIASIAHAHNLILVTHNTNEFRRVAGLDIQDWEAE
jgi:tRNA(fMet)-specific endonuclease VapC